MEASIVATALLMSVVLALQATAADAPRVSKAAPANGAKDVNPNLKELRIEFDRAMNTEPEKETRLMSNEKMIEGAIGIAIAWNVDDVEAWTKAVEGARPKASA